MKKIIALILAVTLIFPFTACENFNWDDSEQSENYSNNGNNGNGNNKENFNSENLSLDAKDIKENDILAIAKKYYDIHSNALSGDLKSEFDSEADAVNFDGTLKDNAKAEKLCSLSAVLATFNCDGNTAAGYAAAAVGWDHTYARSVGALAALLEEAGFIGDKDRLNDAKKLALYAISLDEEDIQLYIILASILAELGDIDGAIKVLDMALAKQPKNYSVLVCKLNLLAEKEASENGKRVVETIIKTIQENDGELSKRLTEQEKEAEKIKPPDNGDSKEEALRKLHEILETEVITPADMLEIIIPKESQQLRDKVNTVTAEDKKLDLLEFPGKMFYDARYKYKDSDGWIAYNMWLLDQENRKSSSSNQGSDAAAGFEITAADYMREYNLNAMEAAIQYFKSYHSIYAKELHDAIYGKNGINDEWLRKIDEAGKKAANEADGYVQEMMRVDPNSENYSAIYNAVNAKAEASVVRMMQAVNTATEDALRQGISLYDNVYADLRLEAEKLWEKMLPFARCAENPEYMSERVHNAIIVTLAQTLRRAYDVHSMYHVPYPEVTYGDVLQAESKETAAAKEYMKEISQPKADLMKNFEISVGLGPAKIKLTNKSAEIEVAAGLAGKVKYDWKSKNVDAGVGLGLKVGGAGVEAGATTYINMSVNTKSGEIKDVYVTGALSGGVGPTSSSAEIKQSILGKGGSVTTKASAKYGNVSVAHKTKIYEW